MLIVINYLEFILVICYNGINSIFCGEFVVIYLILDAFITKNKIQYLKWLIACVASLIVACTFLVLALNFTYMFFIGSISSVSAFFAFLIIMENKRRKDVKERFKKYNQRLDDLKSTLKDFEFSNNRKNKTEKHNWYNPDRIKYLIEMCDSLIHDSTKKDKNIEAFKNAFLPIIGFIAGILADKATLEVNLIIGVIALIIIMLICALREIDDSLNTFVFKSNSVEEITRLKMGLMDLLLRDFPEDAELELKINNE